MVDIVARLLSHTISPAGIAALVLVVLLMSGRAPAGMVAAGAVVFVMLPAVVLTAIARRTETHDIYDPTPSVRQTMLMYGTGCYLVGYVVSEVSMAPPELRWMAATFCAGAAIVWGVDRTWKISIHSTGVGGGAVMLLTALPDGWPLWGSLPALVAWARHRLGAHDLAQLAAGTTLGVALALSLRGLFL